MDLFWIWSCFLKTTTKHSFRDFCLDLRAELLLGFGLATPAKTNLNSHQLGQVSACPTHTDLESAPGAHIRIKMML